MTSGAVENDTVQLAVVKNPNTDLKVVYIALQEVTINDHCPWITKIGKFDLNLTLTLSKNETVEVAVLKNLFNLEDDHRRSWKWRHQKRNPQELLFL